VIVATSVTGSPGSEEIRRGEAAARTTGGSVLRGSAWNVAARIVPQFYVLIMSVVAARFLGPDGMGRQSFISFVALSTVLLFTSGLSQSLTRFIGEQLGADRPATVLDLITWAWRLAAAAAVFGSALLVGVAAAGADPHAAWVLAGVASACAMLHTVPSSVLIGAQRWRQATIVGLATGSITVPATIAVLAAGGGITGIFAVEAVVGAANLVWTTIYARRTARGVGADRRRDSTVRRLAARYAAWSTLSAVLTLIVFRRSEFFFLEAWSTDAEIALYSIAFAAITALVLAFDAAAGAILPAVATLHGAGERDRIRSGYGRTVRMMLLVALPTTAGVLAVGPEIIRLIYGSDYSGTEPVLRLMTVVLPFVPLMYVGNALLVGMGYVWPMLVASAVAAVANVGLAALLIPSYEAVGAALANGGAQVLVAIVVLVICARLVGGNPIDITAVARGLVAAAATGLAAWAPVVLAPGVAGAVAGVVAGVAAFMLAGRLLRILPADDAAWLLGALGRNAFTRRITPAVRFLSRAPVTT
jgi:O-antigen/teichoic acid export membrane protein